MATLLAAAGCLVERPLDEAASPSPTASPGTASAEPTWLMALPPGGSFGLLWLNFTSDAGFVHLDRRTVGLAFDAASLKPQEFFQASAYSVRDTTAQWQVTAMGVGSREIAVGVAPGKGEAASVVFLVEAYLTQARNIRVTEWQSEQHGWSDEPTERDWLLSGPAEVSYYFAQSRVEGSFEASNGVVMTRDASVDRVLGGRLELSADHSTGVEHHSFSSSIVFPLAGGGAATTRWQNGDATQEATTIFATGGPVAAPAGHVGTGAFVGASRLSLALTTVAALPDMQFVHVSLPISLSAVGLAESGWFGSAGITVPMGAIGACTVGESGACV